MVFFLIFSAIKAQDLSKAIVGEDVVFEEKDGIVAVEAEYFYKQTKNDVRAWYRTSKKETPNVGRDDDAPHLENAGNDAYLEILPDTRTNDTETLVVGQNFMNEPGNMAILHYKVKINNPGRYYVWVRAYSTGTDDNGIHVGINGEWPATGARMQWCDGKNSWRWESKQRTEEEHCGVPYLIYLDIEEAGEHEIMFSMREDGFEFDRFLLTSEKEHRPEGIGPDVLLASGKLSESTGIPVEMSGEFKKWHKITLTFDGPEVSENDEYNPFFNYRFNVVFTHEASGKTFKVPGYFSADGNAGETSATSGNKWRAHFAPSETGKWNYKIDFRKGNWVAVSDRKDPGESAGFMDGFEGTFSISESDKTGRDNRAKGMLLYNGTRYLKFTETGEIMLKVGPDAPENFLAFTDFDGNFQNDGHKDDLVKTWEPHLKDWKEGDPTWKNGKGKAIVGAVNYLASKGMNAFSFLTMNIQGDDQNVFPYINYDTYDRFDCSKLDQWEIVFEHADNLGMFLHFKTMEVENQGLLDNGAIGANTKLYYRELIARFGHHLALNWNIGEEIGDWERNHKTPPLFTAQRLAAAEYFYNHDPYHHHVVIHNGVMFDDILGNTSKYTGISLQTHRPDFSLVHGEVLHWLNASEEAGKQLAVAVDEPGDAQHALLPDEEDPGHDNARINGLWGAFMAGAWGTEWYFGYDHAHSDLTCQDYRSRDLFWDQCKYLVDFFKENKIPLSKTKNADNLVQDGDYCLATPGEMYIVLLRNGSGSLDLENVNGNFSVQWYNPREGGKLQKGETTKISGGKTQEILGAPTQSEKDWVVLIKKI